ncbi:DUF423 domain-containing protein [Aestuariibacter sp. AA17]|uniref:DUF423 domain-containing protein n=1 Tax=Fluctibacter corallii TaxID=2984329 RepID=A0ABT3ADB1_9ALTE|nr:DUF423 domain-containing protein [Aestuariibacter sp. AA17]MCV2886656.1 DUF423 domain-containing protein [Aestuariibacter sp. AA17]
MSSPLLYICIAAFFGMTSVMLGAFGAHGLKGKLSDTLLSTFETGVQYQMYHSLAILLIAVLLIQLKLPVLAWAAGFMSLGVVLFSGSLYGLALLQMSWLGPVTPIGGLCMIIGWGILLVSVIRHGVAG